ncbi:MAG: 1-acyl-sn-glycerol-3-phosphate acyltransferase [Spongiibacteraceae bacterium]|jgi:1-acyl-sn-glycerol-3-phosphate acyltransferase|nr:1-acyl-sn-glycerol-3-phosphate acyltransferase [Spongiibacteraceae bacterium]
MEEQFGDIRPYHDHEVRPVVERLLQDDEFIGSLAALRLPRLTQRFPALVRMLVRWVARRELRTAHDIDSVQDLVKRYMDRMIERCTDSFTVSGLERLPADQPYLFMSNHRDIALDPAFINYALYRNDHDTVRIAIGDNLLSKPFAADLMRLNKSFIVKRSAKGPRQMLAAYKTLSAYIRHSITVDRSPIWIAQREGRAKDGLDRTEVAVIKMIAMAQDKASESFAEFIRQLRIVPVAISYEFDPCDELKARELHERATRGSYAKAEHEDLRSIGLGIAGSKGDVHVSFGEPLTGDYADADAVAAEIDRQIISLYVLHPSNFAAYHALHGTWPELSCGADGSVFKPEAHRAVIERFEQRIAALPPELRPYALTIYANPVISKLELASPVAA